MATAIVAQVRIILNDTGVFWPEQTVLDAVNEAQFLVWSETRWALASATLTASTNADVVTIPPSILIPKWIEGFDSNFQPPQRKRFFPTSHRNLEHFLRQWRGHNTGQPVYFITWDATHFRLFPRPDTVKEFTVYGIGLPTEITTSTQTLIGPNAYANAVIYYSAALLFEATRPDLADMYTKNAEEQVLNFKKTLRNHMSHNLRTFHPASTRLEIDQTGEIFSTPSYYPLEGNN